MIKSVLNKYFKMLNNIMANLKFNVERLDFFQTPIPRVLLR